MIKQVTAPCSIMVIISGKAAYRVVALLAVHSLAVLAGRNLQASRA